MTKRFKTIRTCSLLFSASLMTMTAEAQEPAKVDLTALDTETALIVRDLKSYSKLSSTKEPSELCFYLGNLDRQIETFAIGTHTTWKGEMLKRNDLTLLEKDAVKTDLLFRHFVAYCRPGDPDANVIPFQDRRALKEYLDGLRRVYELFRSKLGL